MCILEASFLNKKFSRKVVQAIIVVLAGVAVATVSDVEMNVTGTVAASVGVLSTSAQQILVGHLQKKHNVTSNFLLAKTSLWMAASMLVFGPIMDTLVTGGENVFEYEWTSGSLMFLAVSCGFAVLVNISQYLCIGRFSAVSFQVIGHVKTVLVFLFGFICFNAPITSKNIAGCALAVVGMIYYTQAMNKQKEDEAKGVGMIHSGSSSANLSAKV
jgi:solute carrier family 35 protein E3|tara:strand:+ start:283 stop:927 length:645 start_codon:yes stop_codon:yes gene_type:complete